MTKTTIDKIVTSTTAATSKTMTIVTTNLDMTMIKTLTIHATVSAIEVAIKNRP
jgi:hypothetical protein